MAVHHVANIVATGGLDGRVCVWRLLADLSQVAENEFAELVFRSHPVHLGQ